jgi:XRE family aerobic/anaerobic benzoate catabolism transcriptional regulator
VWLKARAQDHWDRVVAQGDVRPMRGRANAMSELKALLRSRKPLYEQAAHVVDTSSMSLDEAARQVIARTKKDNSEVRT